MRPDYKREDFPTLERVKFCKEVAKGMSVDLLDPDIAKVFPTSEAVNEALLALLTLTASELCASRTVRSAKVANKHLTELTN